MKKNIKKTNNLKTMGAMKNPYFGNYACSICKDISLGSNDHFSFQRKVMSVDFLFFLPPYFQFFSQNEGISKTMAY